MTPEQQATSILENVWQQCLHITGDIAQALADGRVSMSEVAELSVHGVQLVGMILRLIHEHGPDVRQQLRSAIATAQQRPSMPGGETVEPGDEEG